MVPNETTRCEAENCRLEVGLGGRGVLAQPLLFDQPRYQVKNCSQDQVKFFSGAGEKLFSGDKHAFDAGDLQLAS